MRRRWKWIVSPAVLLLLLIVGFYFYAESVYARRINPASIANAREHLHRFGPSLRVYELKLNGRTFYEFFGYPPEGVPFPVMPSGAPSYIYDSTGQRLDWCADPADNRAYREKWPRVAAESVPLGELPESLLR